MLFAEEGSKGRVYGAGWRHLITGVWSACACTKHAQHGVMEGSTTISSWDGRGGSAALMVEASSACRADQTC
jgi:hypothetical protein